MSSGSNLPPPVSLEIKLLFVITNALCSSAPIPVSCIVGEVADYLVIPRKAVTQRSDKKKKMFILDDNSNVIYIRQLQ